MEYVILDGGGVYLRLTRTEAMRVLEDPMLLFTDPTPKYAAFRQLFRWDPAAAFLAVFKTQPKVKHGDVAIAFFENMPRDGLYTVVRMIVDGADFYLILPRPETEEWQPFVLCWPEQWPDGANFGGYSRETVMGQWQ
jgi:hypothetical protein